MSQPEGKFESFEEFWPFYVREHSNKTNRVLHFIGTTLAMGTVATALLTKRRALLLAAPVFGYGFAWVGHFLVEGNKPATFKHPLWSLRGDFRMWKLMATGAMDAEVERITKSNGVHATNGTAPEAAAPAASHLGPDVN
jgi:hypothetical protein